MLIKKNQLVELTITGMTTSGSGVGHIQGENGDKGPAVFVPFTAVGDRLICRIVKVEKRYAYGKIEVLTDPSPDRCEPSCAVYGKCGGCVYRHVSYEAELQYKEQHVRDAFLRIGGLTPPFSPIVGSAAHTGYRNKAQYPVSGTSDCPVIGFYAPRSHRVIEQRDCALQPPIFRTVLDALADWMREAKVTPYDEQSGQGLLRHIYLRQAAATDQLMVCLVTTSGKIPDTAGLLRRLCVIPSIASVCVNINRKDTNVILGEDTFSLYGETFITDELCGKRFSLSPKSFYQVNRDQAQTLYTIAADMAALGPEDVLLDLYCGTGTIGLTMAYRVGQLIGAEIVPQAVEDARKNAAENGVSNARFLCADAAKAAAQLESEGVRPSVVIIDPPRKGCDRTLLETIKRMSPSRVVYVSCDPATLARDCAIFRELGYETKHVTPVDMFPRTAHVETVALLTNGDHGS